jgi:hypothetical protein
MQGDWPSRRLRSKEDLMIRLHIQMTAVAVTYWLLPAAAAVAQVGPPAVEWEKTYDWELFGWAPGQMIPLDFQQTLDGGYILTGMSHCPANTYQGVYLIKTDPTGQVDWARQYDLEAAMEGFALLQKPDGSYVVAYNRSVDGKLGVPGLMETNADGDMTWSRVLKCQYMGVWSMQGTIDGGYILGGLTGGNDNDDNDAILVKTDSAANVIWSRTYGGEGSDRAHSVQQTSDGGYILAGDTFSFGCKDDQMGCAFLVKTDANGGEKWLKTYAEEQNGIDFHSVDAVETGDGGYLILGGMRYLLLIKTDAGGNEESRRRIQEDGVTRAYCVRLTCDGGYILAGTFPDLGAYVVKADANGEEAWSWTSQNLAEGRVIEQTLDGGYALFAFNVVPGKDFKVLSFAKLAPDGDCRPQGSLFRRGDSDADGALQLTDAVFTLNHLFRAGPGPTCADAADADDNGAIEITDAILTLSHLFLGGPALAEPFGSCGSDSTPDELGCAVFSACR